MSKYKILADNNGRIQIKISILDETGTPIYTFLSMDKESIEHIDDAQAIESFNDCVGKAVRVLLRDLDVRYDQV